MPEKEPIPLGRQLRRITVSGCLAMVYTTCVASPVTTNFFREIGATELHFGLLGGIPMSMLAMQFVGAYLTNRVSQRKPWFVVLVIAARLVYIPIVLVPLLAGDRLSSSAIPILIALIALSAGLSNLCSPLWLSWMGDLIPRRVLNRYWGARQQQMTLVWTASFLAVAGFMYTMEELSAPHALAILVVVGCTAGIVDILLFLKIDEPENVSCGQDGFVAEFLEPFRHEEYRTLMRFSCAFTASAMLGAAFMQLYVLKVLAIPVWKTTLIWCTAGIGNALVSRRWGHAADHHGHRPLLVLTATLKPVICLVYILVTPATAVPVLAIAFCLDNMLNAGQAIAINGYMLKVAPRENRSTFIAARTALTGIAGGIGAIVGGAILRHTQSLAPVFLGREWNHYQLLFLLSFLLRSACVPLALAIREARSESAVVVLNRMVGIWPYRMLTFPVGLYRRLRDSDDEESPDEE